MKIVVVGGTGLIGARVVDILRQRGHEVVAASPSGGVNTITGEGLADAIADASVVIDASNSPSNDGAAARNFFETSGRNLLAAEVAARVRHHVLLSIVGADRVPGQGYYEAKVTQEQLVHASTIPYTIIRSTQFFEFLAGIADANTIDGVVRLPVGSLQPVAADDVASFISDVALGAPEQKITEIAGPDRADFRDMIARYLKAIGDRREAVQDTEARYFGGQLDQNSLVPLGEAHLGRLDLDAWLRRTGTRS